MCFDPDVACPDWKGFERCKQPTALLCREERPVCSFQTLELLDFSLPVGLNITLSSLATPQFTTSYHLGTLGVVDGSLAYLYSSVPLKHVVSQSDRIPLQALLRSYYQIGDDAARRSPHPLPPPRPGSSPTSTSADDASSRQQTQETQQTKPQQLHATYGPRSGLRNVSLQQLIDGDYLLYGRLYLPQSTLEASLIKRFTPSLQVHVAAVSNESLRNGGTILGVAQYDEGRFGVEGLASTDGGLLGIRGLYNFGSDGSPAVLPTPASLTTSSPSPSSPSPSAEDAGNGSGVERERIYGRFSAGGELYYGTLNKSGGMSLGTRFATLPAHRGTPLTATLTINPLMGTVSATYAVQARRYCSLATRMDFNVYSYESDWKVGMELWSKRRPGGFLLGAHPDSVAEQSGDAETKSGEKERSFQAKMEWRLDDPEPPTPAPTPRPSTSSDAERDDEYLGVLKARLDQHLRIGLLWEGRIKSLIFSLGTGIDLNRLDRPFQNVGLGIQYSS